MTIRRRAEVPSIEVGGLVGAPRVFGWEDVDRISGQIPDVGEVAEGFEGAAVPVAGMLDAAVPRAGARFVTVESDDGLYRACLPLDELRGKGWLVHKLEGAPLTRERGGPFRLVVPQGRTLCWNVKGVAALRVTAEQEPDSVPANPRH